MESSRWSVAQWELWYGAGAKLGLKPGLERQWTGLGC